MSEYAKARIPAKDQQWLRPQQLSDFIHHVEVITRADARSRQYTIICGGNELGSSGNVHSNPQTSRFCWRGSWEVLAATQDRSIRAFRAARFTITYSRSVSAGDGRATDEQLAFGDTITARALGRTNLTDTTLRKAELCGF